MCSEYSLLALYLQAININRNKILFGGTCMFQGSGSPRLLPAVYSVRPVSRGKHWPGWVEVPGTVVETQEKQQNEHPLS